MDAFSFDDYRLYLKERASADWGSITRMAKAAQCQRSYLSRAIKGEVQLTPDHWNGLCEYWRLPETESEYLMLLLEKARASSAAYRNRVERKLQRLRRERENLTNRLATPRLQTTEREMIYYSAWHWAAIHMATAIPSLQSEQAIAQELQLHLNLVRTSLQQMAEWGLVKKTGTRWVFGSSNLHLPKNSPLIGQHHNHWRQRAVGDSLLTNGDGLHYTQIQAMDAKAYHEIKNLLLATIDRSLKIADPAKEENLIAVNIDAFHV